MEFWLGKDMESGRWKVGIVNILSGPGVGVAVKMGGRDLGGALRNLVVDGQDRLHNRVERRRKGGVLLRRKRKHIPAVDLIIVRPQVGEDASLRRRRQHCHRARIQDWGIGPLVIKEEECSLLKPCKCK